MAHGLVDLGAGDDSRALPEIALTAEPRAGRRGTAGGSTQRRAVDAKSSPEPKRAEKPSATSRTGKTAKVAAKPVDRPSAKAEVPYGGGVMIDDDPFNAAFGNSAERPSLELEASEEIEEERAPEAASETPSQLRARQIAAIAAYGAAPNKLHGAPVYCFRVMVRRRVLEQELREFSSQRKRLDDAAKEAHRQVGEAIYARRSDRSLVGLAKALAAVGTADSEVGQVEARADKRQRDSAAEIARLDAELTKLERIARPLKEQEAALAAEEAALLARAKHAQRECNEVDADLEVLLRPKSSPDPVRRNALLVTRAEHQGELQNVGLELRPVQAELAGAREELAKQVAVIAKLQRSRDGASTAGQRARETERVSSGSAKGDRSRALSALASAALKQGIGEMFAREADAAAEAADQADRLRAQEELHRAAVACYDHKRYEQGVAILLGSSGLLLFSMVLMILF